MRAWRPAVPGVVEAFQARFVTHVYPPHTHDSWTLLTIDDGAVRYDLDRHEHGAVPARLTVLPPGVPHTGRAGSPAGFHKRVLYVDASVLDPDLAGAAVASPTVADAVLDDRVRRLHAAILVPGDELEAESRLALVAHRLTLHFSGTARGPTPPPSRLAADLRDLLDSHLRDGVTLRRAADVLDAHPDALVRAFGRAYGLPPHRYVVGRRVGTARRLLLDGVPPARAAVEAGFHDQAHLTRHFRRLVGTTPARFAAR